MAEASSRLNIGSLKDLAKLGVHNRDIAFAFGVTLVLAMLFVPLPPGVLDFGLAVSLTLSILILMVALWIPHPLEFSSFPTLLLVVTMLRLSLNVASTRLILSEGNTGAAAAGEIIQGFANFIVRGDYIIGAIIFAILMVINFVVITRGSTRIAEVSARFSLDSMPGKQMAIDADLGAGLIDEVEAKARRKRLEDESGFYGAMDGASKFVRGDATAGLIITLINIVGGILIGVVQHGMTLGAAVDSYTMLTIGDGLVTQIPALAISLAAGLIVTKGGTEGAANEAVIAQLSKFPKALFMAAGPLFGVGLLPGFPFLVFAALSLALLGIGWLMFRAAEEEAKRLKLREQIEKEGQAGPTEDSIEEVMRVDEMRLELGSALVPLVDSVDAVLPGKIKSLRNLFGREYGFVLPAVRIKDTAMLPADTYSIHVQGVDVAKGEVHPNSMMVIVPGADVDIPGIKTKEPTFGLDAIWTDRANVDQAEAMGLTVVDPESVITTHLTEVIKDNMHDLLTFGATKALIDGLDRDYQKLVAEISMPTPIILVQQVLQTLLRERVSIRNLPVIAEAIADAARNTKDASEIAEHVRQKLANQICQSLRDEQGFVSVIVLSPQWEAELNEAVRLNGDSKSFSLAPARVQDFVLDARKAIQAFAEKDQWPALLVGPDLRKYVRSMLERVSPTTPVLSHNEIHRKASLRTVSKVGG